MPLSMRLRKSIEISRISANCSWVISRLLRIERNFLPNCFRKVATCEVCRTAAILNTEYYYGFDVEVSKKTTDFAVQAYI